MVAYGRPMAQSLFDKVFAIVVGTEGGFSDDPKDPGNWTGGHVGRGDLKGTKFGVSAASYPDIDIRNLTLDEAQRIYLDDYWDKLRVPLTAPPFALIMFDAAVNHGVAGSIKWMQQALGVADDGDAGPITLDHLNAALAQDPTGLAAKVLARRIHEMPTFGAWGNDGLGWSERCAELPFHAMQLVKEMAA